MTTGEIRVGTTPTFRDVIKDQDGSIVDIGAATIEMVFRKPDGTASKQTAELTNDGSDGKMQYKGATSFLDTVGEWQRESKVTIGSDVFKGTRFNFRVWPALPEA
jgi:hypothetical protein